MKWPLFLFVCLFVQPLFSQENNPRTGVLVAFELQLFSSKPGENRSPEQDPGVMLSFLHPFNEHLAVGLGTGMTSPYYTTTIMPTYIETIYWPLDDRGFHFKGRFGKVVPMNPDLFHGGTYSEIGVGGEIRTKRRTVFVLGTGFSHQRMTSRLDDIWWGNRETSYRFNRAVFSLGMRF
jgi:hypothetical protein